MAEILLLNPPGRKMYLRDSYCSKVSKSSYLYHPVDLLVQWGQLSKQGHEIQFLDCIEENLSVKETISKIKILSPEIIYGLSGFVSFKEDVYFYRELSKNIDSEIYLGGDLFLNCDKTLFSSFNMASGFICDFTTPEFGEYLNNRNKKINSMFKPPEFFKTTPYKGGERSFGILDWEKLKNKNYSYPFSVNAKLATVLTSSGCNYNCDFCVSGNFPLSYRPIEELMEEFRILKNLGYREIYFADQTFNFNKKRTIDLLEKMISEKFNFSWSAFVRIENLDKELLELFKLANCHTLIFGIEAGDFDRRKRYGKNVEDQIYIEKIKLMNNVGIRSVGTFIIGLPDETMKTAIKSVNFAIKASLDFVSFNIAIPRPLTKITKESRWEKFDVADQSSGELHFLDIAEELKGNGGMKFINTGNREFYMRPSYLLQRLVKIKSLHQFKNELIQGFNLIF